MKPRCAKLIETRIGRRLNPGEERFIEQRLLSTLRTEMRENPTKTRALNHGQRIRLAANRAARDLGREQAVTEWNDANLDELHQATREELIKSGFKNINPEFHDDLGGAAAIAFDDAIAFSLEHIEGKSVAAAIRSMQGSLSHEITHVAQDLGAFTPEQINDLNYVVEHLVMRRSDARLLNEEEVWSKLGPKPTYRDYADHVYADKSEDIRAREAVAKGMEAEALRHVKEMPPASGVFRKALGSLIKWGRAILRAVKRLTGDQQEGLRQYLSRAERALRTGEVNRQRYGDKAEVTPPTRIGKIADSVLKNLPEEEVNDLVSRLENPLATASEIADAPIWDTLEQMQNGPTMKPEQATDPAFWEGRRYQVDGKTLTAGELVSHVTAMFAERAGKKGVILGRHATIVTGAPGAGKSSITGHIAHANGAAVIEADAVKPLIPEYNGGLNQADVHPESQAIAGQAMRQFMAHGANLALERIGDNPAGMANLVDILKKQGYKVDVVHVRSDFSTRMRGAAARFLATGRWIPPSSQIEIGNAPTSVHRTVIRNNMAGGTFEVRLNPKGTYDVISKSGKANGRLANAITRAAGGRLARLGQTLSRARFADPRSYALESAKAFRNWNKEVGPTIGRPMANFGGKHAKGADITALRLANQMAKDGVDTNTIKRVTGWWQPLSGGKWRYNLPVGKVTLKKAFGEAYARAHATGKSVKLKLSDAVDSPVFSDYPSLRGFTLVINPKLHGAGVNFSIGHLFALNMEVGYLAASQGTYQQLIAHELQHLIYMVEGYEKGGSPYAIARGIRKGRDAKVPDWAIDFAKQRYPDAGTVIGRGLAAYHALIAEQDAYDSELMESMTPEERRDFEPSSMHSEGLPSQAPFNPTLLQQLKDMPLKWWATIPPTGFIIETLRELLMQTHHAIPPEELFNLPARIESDAGSVRGERAGTRQPSQWEIDEIEQIGKEIADIKAEPIPYPPRSPFDGKTLGELADIAEQAGADVSDVETSAGAYDFIHEELSETEVARLHRLSDAQRKERLAVAVRQAAQNDVFVRAHPDDASVRVYDPVDQRWDSAREPQENRLAEMIFALQWNRTNGRTLPTAEFNELMELEWTRAREAEKRVAIAAKEENLRIMERHAYGRDAARTGSDGEQAGALEGDVLPPAESSIAVSRQRYSERQAAAWQAEQDRVAMHRRLDTADDALDAIRAARGADPLPRRIWVQSDVRGGPVIEGETAARSDAPEEQNVPQELGLQRTHAQRFSDMADRYPPFAKALEKAGIERMPKTLTREQYVRLRRAMRDITDLDFLPEQTALQKKYGNGPGQAAMKFKSYATAEKDFLHFLENGMMDGGFSDVTKPALKRRVIPYQLQKYTGEMIVNPSSSDLYKLARGVKGIPFSNVIRVMRLKDGNTFAVNAASTLHDDMVHIAEKAGYSVEGYEPGFGYQDDNHGSAIEVSAYRKEGSKFITAQDWNRDVPIEHFFPNFRPMEARKPRPMKAYNAKGGRKGAARSSTTYASIPPQPGFIDDVNYVANQIGQIKYRNVAGMMIQDKRMQKLRPWNIAGGKLDEIDKITEGVLRKTWGTVLRNTPIIRNIVQGYFPFGGVPDRVALELLRSLAQGRTGAAQDLAREIAGDISRALKISPLDALRAMRGDYSKQQHVADLMEQVRDAMTDADPTTQAAKMAALRTAEPELYAAVKRARDVIMDIGDALVEHGILHQNQLNKYQGHYLRRAYMEHFESYRPSAGVRASGAHYRKYREGIPEDRRLTKGEIKDVPFLTYLSIEEPLRDLGLYSYLNAIVHYSATAPSNPGWVLPDSIVMFGGKYRTLFYIAKEKEQNDQSLQQKTIQLSNMGGASATNPAAQRLIREIAILAQISKDMENIINTNPMYARALKKGELPKGYRQLPDDTARFGDMAGAIVMRPLYDDIMGGTKEISLDPESFKQRAADMYNGINRNAKFLLTVANPPTHLRNVYSNIISLARSGTNPARVLQAIYEVSEHLRGVKTSPAVAAAIKFGAMKQSFTESELRLMDEFARNVQLQEKRAKQKIRQQANQARMGPASVLLNAPLTALEVAGMIGGAMKDKYASGASWLYQMEDVVFKVAKIADEIDRGTPPALAALEARKHFFDYSAVTDPVRWLRNSAIAPFISYTYFAVPNFIEQAATAPWRLGMSTYIPAMLLLALFGTLWGYESSEAKKALSEHLRDRPMLLPLPWRDEHDRIQWIDLGYILPEGNMIGMLADAARGDYGGAINSIGFSGGPVVTAMIGLETGIDPFRGTPIWDETDDDVTRSEKGFAFAARSFMPSALNYYVPPLPGETAGGPGYEAVAGTGQDRYGEPTQTPGQLASRMAGVNIYPSDVVYGQTKQMRLYDYQITQLRQELRRAYVDERLTPERREARIASLMDRLDRVQTQFSNYVNETANAADIESRRHSE